MFTLNMFESREGKGKQKKNKKEEEENAAALPFHFPLHFCSLSRIGKGGPDGSHILCFLSVQPTKQHKYNYFPPFLTH